MCFTGIASQLGCRVDVPRLLLFQTFCLLRRFLFLLLLFFLALLTTPEVSFSVTLGRKQNSYSTSS